MAEWLALEPGEDERVGRRLDERHEVAFQCSRHAAGSELAMAVAEVVKERHQHDPVWVLDDLLRNEDGRTILHLWHLECLTRFQL